MSIVLVLAWWRDGHRHASCNFEKVGGTCAVLSSGCEEVSLNDVYASIGFAESDTAKFEKNTAKIEPEC